MTDLCLHELPPEQCAYCRSPHLTGQPHAERAMLAQFESRCPDCGRRIQQGSVIGLYQGEWFCPYCIKPPLVDDPFA